LHAQ
jgi:hypothetical protein